MGRIMFATCFCMFTSCGLAAAKTIEPSWYVGHIGTDTCVLLDQDHGVGVIKTLDQFLNYWSESGAIITKDSKHSTDSMLIYQITLKNDPTFVSFFHTLNDCQHIMEMFSHTP